MSPAVKTEVGCGKCSRILTGESLCVTTFTNPTNAESYVALTPNYPAKIVPLKLDQYGGKLILKKGTEVKI